MVPNDKNKSSKDPQDSDWNRKESDGLTLGKIILVDDSDGRIPRPI